MRSKGGEPPTRRGFGLQLIEEIAAYQLDGEVRLEWRAVGLCAAIAPPEALVKRT